MGRDFFPDFCRQCAWWLNHLHNQNDLREHTDELPAWVVRLLGSMEFKTDPMDGARYFARPPDGDAAVGVAARVLGISVRSVYRGKAASVSDSAKRR